MQRAIRSGSGQNLVSEANNKFWVPQQEVLSCLAKKVPKEGAAGEALTSTPIVSLVIS